MDPIDRAEGTSASVEPDGVDLDDVSIRRWKKDQQSDVDVVSISIAMGLGAAVIWYFFFRA